MVIHIKTLGIPPSVMPAYTDPIELEVDATLRDLLLFLTKKHASVTEVYLKSCTFMVNSKKVDLDASLQDGDRVLILRTLGGG